MPYKTPSRFNVGRRFFLIKNLPKNYNQSYNMALIIWNMEK